MACLETSTTYPSRAPFSTEPWFVNPYLSLSLSLSIYIYIISFWKLYFIRMHCELGWTWFRWSRMLSISFDFTTFKHVALERAPSSFVKMIFKWFSFSCCRSLRYFHHVFTTCAVEERLRTSADVLWDCPMAHRLYWVVRGRSCGKQPNHLAWQSWEIWVSIHPLNPLPGCHFNEQLTLVASNSKPINIQFSIAVSTPAVSHTTKANYQLPFASNCSWDQKNPSNGKIMKKPTPPMPRFQEIVGLTKGLWSPPSSLSSGEISRSDIHLFLGKGRW